MKSRDDLKEYRGLDTEELVEKVKNIEEEVMNLRFRHVTGQLEQTAQLRVLRRQVARVKTVLREKQSTPVEAEA